MRVLQRSALPVMLALILAGCSPTSSDSATPPEAEATDATTAAEAEALVGTYSVEYRTTESDFQAITDEVVERDGEVTGSCSGSPCDLAYTIQVKAADGSTTSGTTDVTFDGTAYHGIQVSSFPCDGLTSLTTVEGGLEYTSETTITPSSMVVEDGRNVVESFDVVTVERNEITSAGRDAGCLKINFSGTDPYVTNATTVGVGTRRP
ncbi:MAG: hypothetical protein ABI566_02035 [Pseudolysinimonas sp.]